jgi:hypothetical protein
VDCQLDVLKQCRKLRSIRQALKDLPSTLDETYSRILVHIDELHRNDVRNALMWLAFSERPLYLTELADAMVIDPSTEDVLNPEDRYSDTKSVLEVIPNLVTITTIPHGPMFEPWLSNEDNMVAVMAHFSVKEYLISNRISDSPAAYFALSESISHSYIARSCLRYLLQYATSPLKSSPREDLSTLPLLCYSAKYWYIHINLLPAKEQKLLSPLGLELLATPSSLSSWFEVHQLVWPLTQFYFETEFDQDTALKALHYASDLGLIYVVQELLDYGFDPNHRWNYDETPLHRAVRSSENGDQFMLCDGNSLDLTNNQDLSGIVSMLLDYGALVDARNSFDQTPLHWAAWLANMKMVDLLLQRGADIDAENKYGETALHYAARFDHDTLMLRHLLNRGASVNVQTLNGETPLDWAISHAQEEAVTLLLNAGAEAGSLICCHTTMNV